MIRIPDSIFSSRQGIRACEAGEIHEAKKAKFSAQDFIPVCKKQTDKMLRKSLQTSWQRSRCILLDFLSYRLSWITSSSILPVWKRDHIECPFDLSKMTAMSMPFSGFLRSPFPHLGYQCWIFFLNCLSLSMKSMSGVMKLSLSYWAWTWRVQPSPNWSKFNAVKKATWTMVKNSRFLLLYSLG